MKKPDISVVIPVYNEEENIRKLYIRLSKVLRKMRVTYEIIFVDDGSKDMTFCEIKQVKKKDKNVQLLKMRKNFGQTIALKEGFNIARGKYVITMDGDLQNDPEDIPSMIKKIRKDGYDAVSGWRHTRQDTFGKKFFSRISNFIARKITGLNLHDFGCALKAYKKECVEDLELFGEMHRYVPAILNAQGYNIGEIKIRHHPRIHGKSKYGTGRLLKGFLDIVYIKFWSNYATRPLHLFGTIGLASLATAFIIFLYKISMLIFYSVPLSVGPLLLFSGILVLTSIQFFIFGFLGEMQVRTYSNTAQGKNKRVQQLYN